MRKTFFSFARFILFTLVIALFTAACNDSAAAIEEAVRQTVAARPPVVETVITELPVTVEVMQEMEVTAEVEVTRKVEIEVTRVVEIIRFIEVTPQPSPTPEPSPPPTATPQQVAPLPAASPTPAVSMEEQLVETMERVKRDMTAYIQMIDNAFFNGFINCQEVVNRHDAMQLAPQFDISRATAAAQGAYGSYRAAIDKFIDGTRDITENCRSLLANPDEGSGIPHIQWGLARTASEEALTMIIPAIQALGGDIG